MKLILFIGATLILAFTSSCNTFIGMGRDIKQVGGGLESKAQGGTYQQGATSTTPY